MFTIIKPLYIFLFLVACFLVYSVSIYIKPYYISIKSTYNKEKAIHGRLVWQKYNCQACHQIYGLGGYLGPDLTNEYSKKESEIIIRTIIKTGNTSMPSFQMTENEIQDLIEFFKMIDKSGEADPRNFNKNNDGTITKK